MKKEDYLKLTMAERRKVKYKDLPTGNKAAAIIFIAFIIFIIPFTCSKMFRSSSATEKETSVASRKKDSHLVIVYQIAKEFVKTKLKYPEDADFDWTPTLKQRISDSSYRVMGNVVTKNGFGVKEKFRFNCLLLYKGGNDADTNNWEAMYVGLGK